MLQQTQVAYGDPLISERFMQVLPMLGGVAAAEPMKCCQLMDTGWAITVARVNLHKAAQRVVNDSPASFTGILNN